MNTKYFVSIKYLFYIYTAFRQCNGMLEYMTACEI